MDASGYGLGAFGLVLWIVAIVAAILWFFLPFVVFSMNSKMSRILEQAIKANRRLEKLESSMTGAEPAIDTDQEPAGSAPADSPRSPGRRRRKYLSI